MGWVLLNKYLVFGLPETANREVVKLLYYFFVLKKMAHRGEDMDIINRFF